MAPPIHFYTVRFPIFSADPAHDRAPAGTTGATRAQKTVFWAIFTFWVFEDLGVFSDGGKCVQNRFFDDPGVAFAKIEIGQFDGNVKKFDMLEKS